MEKKIIIKNKVRDFCDQKGYDRDYFVGICLQSKATFDGRRLKADTAGRVYDGETGLVLGTAGLIASALGVSIGDLFDLK
jgi:hypothetical protein